MPYAPKAHKPHRSNVQVKRIDRRASASDRGYDVAWIAAAEHYFSQHPLCEDCGDDSIRATIRAKSRPPIDHIIPIDKTDPKSDPLRLDTEDFRTRCRSCHARKTQYDSEIRQHYERLWRDVGHEEAKRRTLERYREAMVKLACLVTLVAKRPY